MPTGRSRSFASVVVGRAVAASTSSSSTLGASPPAHPVSVLVHASPAASRSIGRPRRRRRRIEQGEGLRQPGGEVGLAGPPRSPACRAGRSRRSGGPSSRCSSSTGTPRRGSGPARTGSEARTSSPGGGVSRSGGRPVIMRSRVWLGFSTLGDRAQQRLGVRVAHLARTAPTCGPARRCLPAYITAISSVRPATTPRSWVTSTIAMKRSVCWSCSRLRISAWTVTSSAVVGSSANSRRGPQARARAIITRWRMPPDSWCGYSSKRRSASGMLTERSSVTARDLRLAAAHLEVQAQRLGDLLADRHDRVERADRVLEDHRRCRRRRAAHLLVVERRSGPGP